MTWIQVGPEGVSGTPQHLIAHDDTADAGPQLTAGWRMQGQELQIFADRLGLIPLFYSRSGSQLVAADDLAELVARLPHPRFDEAAVAVFLQLGFYIAEDTPFEDVKVLPPGGHITWQHGRFALHAPPLPIPEVFTGTWEEALPRYVALFEAAVARRARLGVGRLTVSGGRDSRHLLLELIRQGTPPPALVTQDRPVNTDLDIGRQLAARAGIPHIAVAPFRDGLAEELIKNRCNHYLSDENSWYLQIAPHLEGPLFDGLAGGMLSGTDMFQADRLVAAIGKGGSSDAARALLDRMGSRLRFLHPSFRGRWSRDVALQALAPELARHRHAPNPLTSFLFWNRTRREIALIPLTLASRRVPIRLAYLDAPLMTFLASLPYPAFSGTGFHSFVMARTYPRFADVPYGSKRRPPRAPLQVLAEIAAALRYAAAASVDARACARSVLKALVSADPGHISGWLYRMLPLIQASQELGVPLHADAARAHTHWRVQRGAFPSPQKGRSEE